MSNVVHLMGPTCAGKSTLIQRLLTIAPDRVHAVEVGKMLRAKYGEDYFKGQAAPQHTQKEAWEMYVLGVREGINAGKALILVDGQPRDISQAKDIIGLWRNPHRQSFVLIHASHEERERRARGTRAPGPNLDLALARLNNDYKNCYVVMAELLKADEVIRVIDTSEMVDANALAEQMLAEYA
jgi:predicted kinase